MDRKDRVCGHWPPQEDLWNTSEKWGGGGRESVWEIVIETREAFRAMEDACLLHSLAKDPLLLYCKIQIGELYYSTADSG